MNYNLLRKLLNDVEEFQQVHTPEASYEDFQYWFAQKYSSGPPAEKLGENQATRDYFSQPIGGMEAEISALVGTMYRYAKIYSKKALENISISHVDEFTYLVSLLMSGEMKKSDLIHRNLHEMPTGSEILKRLIKQGLVTERTSATDKRAKILMLSETGRSVAVQALSAMQHVADIVSGNLTQHERQFLLEILRKLDHFHREIYTESKDESLETISREYLTQVPQNENTSKSA